MEGESISAWRGETFLVDMLCCSSLLSRCSLVNRYVLSLSVALSFPAGLANASVGLQFHPEVFWYLQGEARGCSDVIAGNGVEDWPRCTKSWALRASLGHDL